MFILARGWSVDLPPPPSICIEKKDREILEPFFEQIFHHGVFGYVLLGDKPVSEFSFVTFSWKHFFSSLCSLTVYFRKGNQLTKKGWETWKKYSPMCSDQFLFVEEKRPDRSSTVVHMINRELFCKVVDMHRSDFEDVLGRKITGEQLFEEAKHRLLFSDLLQNHHGLLGILLGFGRNNAWDFSQKKTSWLGIFPKKEDEIEEVSLPVFRADWKNPETILLRESYLKNREKIRSTYANSNVLDRTLEILAQKKST